MLLTSFQDSYSCRDTGGTEYSISKPGELILLLYSFHDSFGLLFSKKIMGAWKFGKANLEDPARRHFLRVEQIKKQFKNLSSESVHLFAVLRGTLCITTRRERVCGQNRRARLLTGEKKKGELHPKTRNKHSVRRVSMGCPLSSAETTYMINSICTCTRILPLQPILTVRRINTRNRRKGLLRFFLIWGETNRKGPNAKTCRRRPILPVVPSNM